MRNNNSDTFSVCVAISVYRTTTWPCLPSSSKHALWKDKDSARIGTSVGELQTHNQLQGLLRRKMATTSASCSQDAVAVYLEDGDIEGATLEEPLEAKTIPQLRCFRLSSPCWCVCSSPTPVPILLESLSFHRACLDEDGKQGHTVVRYKEIATQTLKVSLYFS